MRQRATGHGVRHTHIKWAQAKRLGPGTAADPRQAWGARDGADPRTAGSGGGGLGSGALTWDLFASSLGRHGGLRVGSPRRLATGSGAFAQSHPFIPLDHTGKVGRMVFDGFQIHVSKEGKDLVLLGDGFLGQVVEYGVIQIRVCDGPPAFQQVPPRSMHWMDVAARAPLVAKAGQEMQTDLGGRLVLPDEAVQIRREILYPIQVNGSK